MKRISAVFVAVMALLAVAPLAAQTGCVNSPENPTAVLAMVGGAGAFLAAVRNRFRK